MELVIQIAVLFISIKGHGVQTEEITLCSSVSSYQYVSCPDGVIYSQNFTVYSTPPIANCQYDQIPENSCSDSFVYRTFCHSHRLCRIVADRLSPTCSQTNIVHFQYDCYKPTVLATPVTGKQIMTGKRIDIMSPGYPCNLPEEQTLIRCTMKPFGTNVQIKWKVERASVYTGRYECMEIHQDGLYYMSACTYSVTKLKLEWQPLTTVELVYNKTRRVEGGVFWIAFEAEDENEEIQIELTCTIEALRELHGEVSSCQPFTTTTVMPPSTTTTTKKTTTRTTGATTTTGENQIGIDNLSNSDSGEEESNEFQWAALTGGLALLVIFIIVISGILLCKIRRQSKRGEPNNGKTPECNAQSDGKTTTNTTTQGEQINTPRYSATSYLAPVDSIHAPTNLDVYEEIDDYDTIVSDYDGVRKEKGNMYSENYVGIKNIDNNVQNTAYETLKKIDHENCDSNSTSIPIQINKQSNRMSQA